MKCRWIAISLLALASSFSAQAVHVQWESNDLPFIIPPKHNPGVSDPDRGIENLEKRRIEVRGLSMDFKRINDIELQLFNNTKDLPQTDAHVEIENVIVVSGFGAVKRGKGFKNFYVQGNGPVVVDLLLLVSNKTNTNDLVIKVTSPYR